MAQGRSCDLKAKHSKQEGVRMLRREKKIISIHAPFIFRNLISLCNLFLAGVQRCYPSFLATKKIWINFSSKDHPLKLYLNFMKKKN